MEKHLNLRIKNYPYFLIWDGNNSLDITLQKDYNFA